MVKLKYCAWSSTVLLRNMSEPWSQWRVSDRISSRTSGGEASSQTRGHIGDPVLAAHWIPLSSWAHAIRITVREERYFLMRQAFLSVCVTTWSTCVDYILTAHVDKIYQVTSHNLETIETKKGNTKGTPGSVLTVIKNCRIFWNLYCAQEGNVCMYVRNYIPAIWNCNACHFGVLTAHG